jgi:hypothetical protein
VDILSIDSEPEEPTNNFHRYFYVLFIREFTSLDFTLISFPAKFLFSRAITNEIIGPLLHYTGILAQAGKSY